MRLGRIIVFTPDVDRLAEFYSSVFSLEMMPGGDPSWRELNAGGCSIAFHRIDESSNVRDGWLKLVFSSDDVVGTRSRLLDLGVEMSEVVTFGDIELCDGKDPDGNTFQISSRPTAGALDHEGH